MIARIRQTIVTGEILRSKPDRDVEPPELDAYSAEETWRPRPPPRVDEDGLEDVDEDEDEEVNP